MFFTCSPIAVQHALSSRTVILSDPGVLPPVWIIQAVTSSSESVRCHGIDSGCSSSHACKSRAALNLAISVSRKLSALSSGSDTHLSSPTFNGGGSLHSFGLIQRITLKIYIPVVASSTSFLQFSLFVSLTAALNIFLACAATSGKCLKCLYSWSRVLQSLFHHGANLPHAFVGFRPTALTASWIASTKSETWFSISVVLLIGPGFTHALKNWEIFSRSWSRTLTAE